MGSVDAGNARRKNHDIGGKHAWKNNRTFLDLWHQTELQNAAFLCAGHMVWKEVEHSKLLLELCQKWADEHETSLGETRIPKRKTMKGLEATVRARNLCPNTRNFQRQLVQLNDPNSLQGQAKRTRINCFVCPGNESRTYVKCDICDIHGQEFGLCNPATTGRNCFANFKFHQWIWTWLTLFAWGKCEYYTIFRCKWQYIKYYCNLCHCNISANFVIYNLISFAMSRHSTDFYIRW